MEEDVCLNLKEVSQGSMSVPSGAHVNRNEKRVMRWLADEGHVVKANPIKNVVHQKNPDFTIDGKLWELKTISGSDKNTIVNALKHGGKQSDNIILDITDTSLSTETVIGIARARMQRPVVHLKRVWIVKNGETIGIYES